MSPFSGFKCNFDWLLSDEEQSAVDVSPSREQPQVMQAQKLDIDRQVTENKTFECEEKIDFGVPDQSSSAYTPFILAS